MSTASRCEWDTEKTNNGQKWLPVSRERSSEAESLQSLICPPVVFDLGFSQETEALTAWSRPSWPMKNAGRSCLLGQVNPETSAIAPKMTKTGAVPPSSALTRPCRRRPNITPSPRRPGPPWPITSAAGTPSRRATDSPAPAARRSVKTAPAVSARRSDTRQSTGWTGPPTRLSSQSLPGYRWEAPPGRTPVFRQVGV